jgi:hypothetical protein
MILIKQKYLIFLMSFLPPLILEYVDRAMTGGLRNRYITSLISRLGNLQMKVIGTGQDCITHFKENLKSYYEVINYSHNVTIVTINQERFLKIDRF